VEPDPLCFAVALVWPFGANLLIRQQLGRLYGLRRGRGLCQPFAQHGAYEAFIVVALGSIGNQLAHRFDNIINLELLPVAPQQRDDAANADLPAVNAHALPVSAGFVLGGRGLYGLRNRQGILDSWGLYGLRGLCCVPASFFGPSICHNRRQVSATVHPRQRRRAVALRFHAPLKIFADQHAVIGGGL
jgi:hypothetical protein